MHIYLILFKNKNKKFFIYKQNFNQNKERKNRGILSISKNKIHFYMFS